MLMTANIMVAFFSAPLAFASYSETQAVSNLYLAVSAYCGAPKFNASFLQSWSCGASCVGAGSVTGIDLFQDSDLGVFGLTGHFDGHCILDFRGTSSSDGWKSDLDASLTDLNWTACSGGCQVESGFNKGYIAVRPAIASSLASYGCKDLTVTGHSLGAALATLAAYDFGSTYTILDVYNFGSPRVGNAAFASAYNAKYANHWRVTHYKDPIPHGPTLGMGFQHVANEAYYVNTTAAGYTICTADEDKSCADQFGGSLFADLALAACCADDHLEYMQNSVNIATDGDSCTHVAVATAVQHAYLTTAAYCEPEQLRQWNCGTPCDRVEGGVRGVQILDVPFVSRIQNAKHLKGAIRGFVGHVETAVGDRCVLSVGNLFSDDEGLEVIKMATSRDLAFFPYFGCKNCKVYKVLLDAYRALKRPLFKALREAGCHKYASSTSKRRLVITGHGLGSSVGAIVAFMLKEGTGYKRGSFGIEVGFQFGATRVGNQAFADAFRHKIGGDIFRVTHGKDPYVQNPRFEEGFVHMDQELYFEGDAAWDESNSLSYMRCAANGEDPRCAQRHRYEPGPMSHHTQYLQPLVEIDMSASSCKSTNKPVVV